MRVFGYEGQGMPLPTLAGTGCAFACLVRYHPFGYGGLRRLSSRLSVSTPTEKAIAKYRYPRGI
jgi:hypothetical protein